MFVLFVFSVVKFKLRKKELPHIHSFLNPFTFLTWCRQQSAPYFLWF
nr:MAG TPA: hypothetical protein [Caudoviricetes sp.]